MSAFSTAYKITYMQGCVCLYSQHLVGWCKISSSQTKPTTNTTKYPKCVTASLTSSDSKEIRILWNNQALCILKVPCLPMSPTKAWKCIVLGTQLSGRILTQYVQDSVHSAERREKHLFFSLDIQLFTQTTVSPKILYSFASQLDLIFTLMVTCAPSAGTTPSIVRSWVLEKAVYGPWSTEAG